MKHLFVPYEIALLAKEKGFDESCLTVYQPNLSAPHEWTLQSIIASIYLHAKIESADSHKSNFTGYKNSIGLHYGLKSCTAPLYQQLIDWFRDTHNIEVFAHKQIESGGYRAFVQYEDSEEWIENLEAEGKTYYESINKALLNAFKLI